VERLVRSVRAPQFAGIAFREVLCDSGSIALWRFFQQSSGRVPIAFIASTIHRTKAVQTGWHDEARQRDAIGAGEEQHRATMFQPAGLRET
jgi:hypothetical protein